MKLKVLGFVVRHYRAITTGLTLVLSVGPLMCWRPVPGVPMWW